MLNHASDLLILNKWLNELTCLSAVEQPNQMKITIVADGDKMLAGICLANFESIYIFFSVHVKIYIQDLIHPENGNQNLPGANIYVHMYLYMCLYIENTIHNSKEGN